jgi:hypothetical protein
MVNIPVATSHVIWLHRIFIPGLKKIDFVVTNKIDNSVFLCEPSRSSAGRKVLERLDLPWEWFSCFWTGSSGRRYIMEQKR